MIYFDKKSLLSCQKCSEYREYIDKKLYKIKEEVIPLHEFVDERTVQHYSYVFHNPVILYIKNKHDAIVPFPDMKRIPKRGGYVYFLFNENQIRANFMKYLYAARLSHYRLNLIQQNIKNGKITVPSIYNKENIIEHMHKIRSDLILNLINLRDPSKYFSIESSVERFADHSIHKIAKGSSKLSFEEINQQRRLFTLLLWIFDVYDYNNLGNFSLDFIISQQQRLKLKIDVVKDIVMNLRYEHLIPGQDIPPMPFPKITLK